MDQTVAVAEGNVCGGSKVVRPGRQKGTLIMNNFGYCGSDVPVVWGSFYGYPPGYGGPASYAPSEIPAYAPTIGPGTGTGTFETVWSKPIQKQQKYRSSTRNPSQYCETTIVDGQPLKIRAGTRPGEPLPIINDQTGKPVYEDPEDIEEDKKFFEDMFTKAALQDGFDSSNPLDRQPCELPPGSFYVSHRDRNFLVYQLREYLKYEEQRFKRQYSYGITAYGSSDPFTGSMESRHCITVRSNPFCWMDKSSGIKWVGIYGIDALCVVTLCGHVDWNRVHGGLATRDSKTVLSLFRKCVLSELEDLAEPCNDKARRRFDVPFCVASATPDESGDETSIVDYAAKAIDFVRSTGLLPKVGQSDAAIGLAISAFERLIGKKCEAEEIEATVVYGRGHGIPTYKDLDISEIAAAIAIINSTSETVV